MFEGVFPSSCLVRDKMKKPDPRPYVPHLVEHARRASLPRLSVTVVKKIEEGALGARV